MNNTTNNQIFYTQEFLKSIFEYFLFECIDREVIERTQLTSHKCIKTLVVDDEVIVSKTISASGVIYKSPNIY